MLHAGSNGFLADVQVAKTGKLATCCIGNVNAFFKSPVKDHVLVELNLKFFAELGVLSFLFH